MPIYLSWLFTNRILCQRCFNLFFGLSFHKQTNGSMTRRNTYVCERSTDRYSAIPNGKDSR